MCGLVAMICKTQAGFIYKDNQVFEQLLYIDALRGADSTGVFGVNKHGNVDMMKAAKPSADFIRTKAWEDFKNSIFSKHRIVVGHNRAATKGVPNDENAHPFIEDHICLVHNGTLTNHKELADTVVDSHAICHAIAKEGYETALPKLKGAYALIWYDINEKKLYVAKNDQRPLWIIQTKDTDYIASEPEMLTWILRRVHNKIEKAAYFDPEKIYSWDVENLTKGFTVSEAPKKVQPSTVTTIFSRKPRKAKRIKTTGKTSSVETNIKPIVLDKDDLGNAVFGDIVHYTYENATINGKTIQIKGLAEDRKTKVTGHLMVDNYTADELEVILESSIEFSGSFVGWSKERSTGKSVMLLQNVKPVPQYDTVNNHTVSLRQIQEAGHCCNKCGSLIEPEEEDGSFWARFNNSGEITSMLCSTCVATHPHISKLLEGNNQCTSESSSSDTKQVPVPYVH